MRLDSSFTDSKHRGGFHACKPEEHSGWSLSCSAHVDEGLSWGPGPGILAQTPWSLSRFVISVKSQSPRFQIGIYQNSRGKYWQNGPPVSSGTWALHMDIHITPNYSIPE